MPIRTVKSILPVPGSMYINISKIPFKNNTPLYIIIYYHKIPNKSIVCDKNRPHEKRGITIDKIQIQWYYESGVSLC